MSDTDLSYRVAKAVSECAMRLDDIQKVGTDTFGLRPRFSSLFPPSARKVGSASGRQHCVFGGRHNATPDEGLPVPV